MRPAGKARRPRISGIFEGGATQPDGMQRRPNAVGLSPRAARPASRTVESGARLDSGRGSGCRETSRDWPGLARLMPPPGANFDLFADWSAFSLVPADEL